MYLQKKSSLAGHRFCLGFTFDCLFRTFFSHEKSSPGFFYAFSVLLCSTQCIWCIFQHYWQCYAFLNFEMDDIRNDLLHLTCNNPRTYFLTISSKLWTLNSHCPFLPVFYTCFGWEKCNSLHGLSYDRNFWPIAEFVMVSISDYNI